MEARGVEPLSESFEIRFSPGAAQVLVFPRGTPHVQVVPSGSFINLSYAQSFAQAVALKNGALSRRLGERRQDITLP